MTTETVWDDEFEPRGGWHHTPAGVRASIRVGDRCFLSPEFIGTGRSIKLQASLWYERQVKPQLKEGSAEMQAECPS